MSGPPSCGRTPPWTMSIVTPFRPTCRCRAWWSSTRPPWPRRPSTWPGRSAGRPGGAGRGRRDHGPTGIRHRLGRPAPARPLGPGLGWQDLRTVGTCLELQAEGRAVLPERVGHQVRLAARAGRPGRPATRAGSARSTAGWPGSSPAGALHVTDASNAGRDRPLPPGRHRLAPGSRRTARHRPAPPCRAIVDSVRAPRRGHRPAGRPPLCALVGDQQASLVGQGCTRPGWPRPPSAPGAMLDVCLGDARPASRPAATGGCFPIIAWQRHGAAHLGRRGHHAGRRHRRRLAGRGPRAARQRRASPRRSPHACDDTGGVVAVPALLGFGTPQWDFGARGALFGLTRGTGRPEMVRAVLEGVAHSGRRPARSGRGRRRRRTSATCASTAA